MANHRSRSSSRGRRRRRSRSRSPATRKEDNRDKRGERRSPALSCLYVRNIRYSASREYIRVHFEKFGPLEDFYLPDNHCTGTLCGFGFVKFLNPEDAAEAQKQLDRTLICGRVVTVAFTTRNRKTPAEMRKLTGPSYRGSHWKRSPLSSPRQRYHSYSRSPFPARHDSSYRGSHWKRSPLSSPRQRYRSYSRSHFPARHDSSYRGSHWKRSPLSSPRQRYRSYSRSRSPARHDLRRHRSRERSRRHRKSSPHDEKSQKSNRGSPSSKEKVRTDYAPRRSPAKSRSRYYSRR